MSRQNPIAMREATGRVRGVESESITITWKH